MYTEWMAVGRGAGGLAALLLLLCSASTGLAQSETGASIIQTTEMAFRLTGSVASNFSTSQQTQFSDQLRALLQSFNFMSVAVSDYSVCSPLDQMQKLCIWFNQRETCA